jgi:amino-acid N-acetyltransferase
MISSLMPEDVAERTVKPRNLTVRKAAMRDIAPMLEVINEYAAKGIMLPRTEFEMSENMRDFSVVYSGNELLGCGALHFYSPTMGEVRSLAVAEKAKTMGIGRLVVETLVKEALDYELDAIFAFTYVPGFFAKVGFDEIERGELPLKAWKDCLRCPKFQSCDEIAVLRVLNPERWEVSPAEPGPWEQGLLVQLPTVRHEPSAR